MTTLEQKQQAAREAYGRDIMTAGKRTGLVEGAIWAEGHAIIGGWYTQEDRPLQEGDYVVVVTEDDESYVGLVTVKPAAIWLGPQGISKEHIARYLIIPKQPL